MDAQPSADRLAVATVESGPSDFHGAPLHIVLAETRTGRRFVLSGVTLPPARAARLAERVRAAGSIDPALWDELDPVYGSDAHIAEEAEAVAWVPLLCNGTARLDDVPETLRTML